MKCKEMKEAKNLLFYNSRKSEEEGVLQI